jgi:hypothetical protein
MSDDLTEDETLIQAIKIMECVLENGTHLEKRLVNMEVSSKIANVEDIVRKYWPLIVADAEEEAKDMGEEK